MPFKKGQSGNPGGRPKVLGEVRELAQKHGPECITGLLEIARNTQAPAPARVAAYNALLDRGYGKPHQETTTHLDDQRELTVAEREAEQARLVAKMRGLLKVDENGRA